MQYKPSPALTEEWLPHELEAVAACPFCNSGEREIAYTSVQDWAFFGSRGKWTYWDCRSCGALYLNPRPSKAAISKAYKIYYTHKPRSASKFEALKTRIRNECISHWLNTNLEPRIGLPRIFSHSLAPLRKFINIPFGIRELINTPAGRLLDIGSGNGDMLNTARALGWEVTGLELDPEAVKYSKSQNLNVFEGSFYDAKGIGEPFDCIICSHVIEHVHQPNDLLTTIREIIKPGGLLLISAPNSKSHLRTEFGENWRGLEAPRHLAIPSLQFLKSELQGSGFTNISQQDVFFTTQIESTRIKSRKTKTSIASFFLQKLKLLIKKSRQDSGSDFIQIVAYKAAE